MCFHPSRRSPRSEAGGFAFRGRSTTVRCALVLIFVTAAKCGKSCLPQNTACAFRIVLLFSRRTIPTEVFIHALNNELLSLALLLAAGSVQHRFRSRTRPGNYPLR